MVKGTVEMVMKFSDEEAWTRAGSIMSVAGFEDIRYGFSANVSRDGDVIEQVWQITAKGTIQRWLMMSSLVTELKFVFEVNE